MNSLQPSHRILEEDASSPPRFDSSSGAVEGKALGGSNPRAASGRTGAEMTYTGQKQGQEHFSPGPRYEGRGYRNPSSSKDMEDYSEEARLQESYDGIPYSEGATGPIDKKEDRRDYDHGGGGRMPPPPRDRDGRPHETERRPYYDSERGAPRFDRGAPDFDRGAPVFDRGDPGFDRGAPGFDRGAPDFDRGDPDFDRGAPGFDRGAPGFDRGAPGFDRGAPSFDRGAPDFDRGAPDFDLDRRGPYDRDSRPLHPDMDPGRMDYNYGGSSGYPSDREQRYRSEDNRGPWPPREKDWDNQGHGTSMRLSLFSTEM